MEQEQKTNQFNNTGADIKKHYFAGSHGAGKVVIGILVVFLIVYVGVLIRKELKNTNPNLTAISVSGTGEVLGIKPDIATFSFSVRKEAKQAVDAQKQATEISDKILAAAKEYGVEDKDIKTTYYSLSPRYDYLQSVGQVFRGYEVNQTFEVKVRDLEKVGEILVKVTEAGATNVDGPSFTVNEQDEKKYVVEARNNAIDRAKEKAQQIADGLGVKLGKITSFSEDESYSYIRKEMYNASMSFADTTAGYGAAPSLPAGETQISRTVYLSFEVK